MPSTTKFQFVTTDDGSASARISFDDGQAWGESMHSLRGAFSETVYIYGTALVQAASLNAEPRVLSMGLGLGYVELLAAGVACASGRKVCGESFEIVPELRDSFTAWLAGGEIAADLQEAYDGILDRTAREINAGLPGARSAAAENAGFDAIVRAHERVDLSPSSLKSALAKAVAAGDWNIREALEPSTHFEEKFGCICFDAFSSKSTPDLWTEEFLISFLQKTAAPTCVLSTYACTGALKRALRTEHFTLDIREGFSSKRDSTFATRSETSSL